MADVICGCGHPRKSHSRTGCLSINTPNGKTCTCTVTYMDLAPPDNPSSKRKK
jgi:hypothetical protein